MMETDSAELMRIPRVHWQEAACQKRAPTGFLTGLAEFTRIMLIYLGLSARIAGPFSGKKTKLQYT
jgi:hypothetical protein